jgi:putative membrane protein
LRTGLAFLSVGLAAQRFLGEALLGCPYLRVMALVLVVCALGCFCAAAWRDHTVRRRLASARVGIMPDALTLGIALLLSAFASLAAVTLWRV